MQKGLAQASWKDQTSVKTVALPKRNLSLERPEGTTYAPDPSPKSPMGRRQTLGSKPFSGLMHCAPEAWVSPGPCVQCFRRDGGGVGAAWGKEGWGPDPTEINSEERPHPRVKGASGWGASGQGPKAFSHSVGLSLLNCWSEEKKKLQLASPA